MKIGDKVKSKNVRPNDIATVIKTELKLVQYADGKKEPRTKYIAEYDDKSLLMFYGSQVNTTISKVEESNGQLIFNFEEKL